MGKEPQKLKKAMVYYEKVLRDCEIVGCGCQADFLHPDMDEVLELIDPEILSAPFGSASPFLPILKGALSSTLAAEAASQPLPHHVSLVPKAR